MELRKWLDRLPAILAFALLAFQLALPWTVPHFATQDGPSHIYTAGVATDLILHHGHSHFSPVYQMNRRLVPNWTATILFALL